MTRITWGDVGSRYYNAGVDRGVLYVNGEAGIPWSGLVSVEEKPSGGDPDPVYLDGIKILNEADNEEFEGSINAYYSPKEFDSCDGTNQVRPGLRVTQSRRESFGFSYRSGIGNDTSGHDYGYRIHVVYNATAKPSGHTYGSLSDKTDPDLLTWDVTTKPILITGIGYRSHLIVDSTEADPTALEILESILYGDDENTSRLPTVDEMVGVFSDVAPLVVTDIGDDKFEISGSGFAVMLVDEGQYQITTDTIVFLEDGQAEISSE